MPIVYDCLGTMQILTIWAYVGHGENFWSPRALKNLEILHEIIKWNEKKIDKGFISYLEVTVLKMVHWIGRNQLQKIEGKKYSELSLLKVNVK